MEFRRVLFRSDAFEKPPALSCAAPIDSGVIHSIAITAVTGAKRCLPSCSDASVSDGHEPRQENVYNGEKQTQAPRVQQSDQDLELQHIRHLKSEQQREGQEFVRTRRYGW